MICRSGSCEEAILCFEPDKECNKQNKEDRVHKFPVPEKIKKLVSCLMTCAAADQHKKSVWDEIKVRED